MKISQEDLARYLGLSWHMLQSVELERRQLPLASLRQAMILFKVIADLQTRGFAADATLSAGAHTGEHARRIKRLHGQCRSRLTRCERKLEAMRQSHTVASKCLSVYQQLAQALADDGDQECKKWAQRKIEETTRQVKDNDTASQELLALEIAVLKGIMRGYDKDEHQNNE